MDVQLSAVRVDVEPNQSLFKVESLKFSTGTKAVLFGSSGRGKTTFLHLLAGLFLPSSGSILLGDTQINALNEAERSAFRRTFIGVVFQSLQLIPHFSALENVVLGGSGAAHEKRAVTLLERLGMADYRHKQTRKLSMGQQQRVVSYRKVSLNFQKQNWNLLIIKNSQGCL